MACHRDKSRSLWRNVAALQAALGCVPSVYACYCFTAKLRANGDALNRCIDGVLSGLAADLCSDEGLWPGRGH